MFFDKRILWIDEFGGKMENISTKKHASVSVGIYQEKVGSGTIVLSCSICGKIAKGGYGEKDESKNRGQDILEVELDAGECVPFRTSINSKKVLSQNV